MKLEARKDKLDWSQLESYLASDGKFLEVADKSGHCLVFKRTDKNLYQVTSASPSGAREATTCLLDGPDMNHLLEQLWQGHAADRLLADHPLAMVSTTRKQNVAMVLGCIVFSLFVVIALVVGFLEFF